VTWPSVQDETSGEIQSTGKLKLSECSANFLCENKQLPAKTSEAGP